MKRQPSAILARILAAACLLISFSETSPAGDYANRQILGFSPDGSTFAFEQFGIQDGSGFPYADIFIIDTASDQWIKGSPFSARLEDERAQQKWARRDALSKAGNTLREKLITAPGRLLASNPPSEVSANPHSVTVNTARSPTMTPERWTFTLNEVPLTSPKCSAFTSQGIKGFRLVAQQEGKQPGVLHTDTQLPNSRGCALRYAISDIIIHEPDNGPRSFAILISIFSHGFEGPDRRFIAVTARFP